jgi:site-specific recombinase XerD
MNSAKTPIKVTVRTRLLTAAEFQRLAEVPPEAEWFKNIRSPATKRAYENAIKDFMRFVGIKRPEEFRDITRAHVIAWRDELGERMLEHGETLSGTTIRHRLSALSSLFQYLCDKNAVQHNPVKGVKRPRVETEEGKTPALGDHQARKLLVSPDEKSIKGLRDRAILATLLYHALRRDELCKLRVRDFKHERRGRPHLKVSGKGEKIRYVPLHGVASDLINDYLKKVGHGDDNDGALFRPLRDRRGGGRKKAITPDGVYKLVRKYSALLGFEIGAHALRATAATNALDHNADIAKVQEWLGHANIATTRIYDHRKTRPEDSPTFKVSYQ